MKSYLLKTLLIVHLPVLLCGNLGLAEDLPLFPDSVPVSADDIMAQAVLNVQKKAVDQNAKVQINAYRIPPGTSVEALADFYQKSLPVKGWTKLPDSLNIDPQSATWTKDSSLVFVWAYLNNPADKVTYLITTLCESGCSFLAADGLEKRSLSKESANASGALKLNIVVSDSTDFIAEWMRTGTNRAPHIRLVDTTEPDKILYCAFLVSGYSASPSGQYQVTVDWRLLKPDGTVMFEQQNYAKADGKMPSTQGFVMADNALDIVLEKDDPLGTYTLEGTARDLITGSTTTTSYSIKLRSASDKPSAWSGKGQI